MKPTTSEPITYEDLMLAAEILRTSLVDISKTEQPLMVHTGGTGIPDEMRIDHYNGTGIQVMTRDGSIWKNGEKIYEARIH